MGLRGEYSFFDREIGAMCSVCGGTGRACECACGHAVSLLDFVGHFS